jgi:RHS repeat-associated protein
MYCTTTFSNTTMNDIVYYLYDHLGNTRLTYSVDFNTNSTMTIHPESAFDYDPYGVVLRQFSTGPEPYLTTQHQRDTETGLDYRGARFYDAEVGRFLSVDPLAIKYPAYNTYSYVGGMVNSLIDANGKDWFVSQTTGQVAFVQGVSCLSNLDPAKYDLSALGDLTQYQNWGEDDLLGETINVLGKEMSLNEWTRGDGSVMNVSRDLLNENGFDIMVGYDVEESHLQQIGMPSEPGNSSSTYKATQFSIGLLPSARAGSKWDRESSNYPVMASGLGVDWSYKIVVPFGTAPETFAERPESRPEKPDDTATKGTNSAKSVFKDLIEELPKHLQKK